MQLSMIQEDISVRRCWDAWYTGLEVDESEMDGLKVSWDDSSCKLISKMCHWK